MKDNIFEQLTHSMKAFLFFEAYTPSNLEYSMPISQIRIGGEALDSTLVLIALKKWEIHHAYRLEAKNWMSKSIRELVNNAKKLNDQERQEYVNGRMEEIAELLNSYLTQSNKEHGLIGKIEYLLNIN